MFFAALNSVIQLSFGSIVLLQMDLSQVFNGTGMEMIELRPQGSYTT